MENQTSIANVAHAGRLKHCLKYLEGIVTDQEAILTKLRESSASLKTSPSAGYPAHLYQLRALTAAYESLTSSELQLPHPDSPLPSIIALRNLCKTTQETTLSLKEVEIELANLERRVQKEEADLNDAKVITKCVETRITSLHVELQERIQNSPLKAAHAMMRKLRKERALYDTDTGELVMAFNSFIDTYLAAMLAAEEMGGPVVGEMLAVDGLALEAGFNTKGRPRRSKELVGDNKRQQKIDEVWGSRVTDVEQGQDSPDGRQAAAAELRELTEELLNQAVQAGEEILNGYVELEKESAAARFLVRSRVAQLHPKDAGRLRLIDFGRDLGD